MIMSDRKKSIIWGWIAFGGCRLCLSELVKGLLKSMYIQLFFVLIIFGSTAFSCFFRFRYLRFKRMDRGNIGPLEERKVYKEGCMGFLFVIALVMLSFATLGFFLSLDTW